MARPRADNRYSRFVGWVKILLPVAALGLLSSLFLLARNPAHDGTLPFSEVELEELARGQGIRGPHYTGVTKDGQAISLMADKALPRLSDRRVIDAEAIRAEIETQDAGQVRVAAAAAVIDTGAGRADLSGGVVVETGAGHRMETDALTAALDGTGMETDARTLVTAPGLRIEAGGMELRAQPGGTDGAIVVFKSGVNLIYTPQSEQDR